MMDLESTIPYFLIMASICGLIILPLYRGADTPPNMAVSRVSTLDGLRGFLALNVFFQHAIIFHEFLQDQKWILPRTNFYDMLGGSAVSTFFMITAYLFWSKMIKSAGKPDWLKLYTGRIFRIGPVYLVAVSILVPIVLYRTEFHLDVPLFHLLVSLVRWSALGALGKPDIDGYPQTALLMAGVTWTLYYEWIFYGALIFIAFAARKISYSLAFSIIVIVASLGLSFYMPKYDAAPFLYACFGIGMLVSTLKSKGNLVKISEPFGSCIALFLIAVSFDLNYSAYEVKAVLINGLFFYLIVSGTNIFGLLTARFAIRLGNISYDIYLLQGLVFTILFSVPFIRDFGYMSILNYWLLIAVCTAIIISVSTISHVLIERPSVELGKRFGRMLSAMLKRKGVVASAA